MTPGARAMSEIKHETNTSECYTTTDGQRYAYKAAEEIDHEHMRDFCPDCKTKRVVVSSVGYVWEVVNPPKEGRVVTPMKVKRLR
jgi:hypothetical protein